MRCGLKVFELPTRGDSVSYRTGCAQRGGTNVKGLAATHPPEAPPLIYLSDLEDDTLGEISSRPSRERLTVASAVTTSAAGGQVGVVFEKGPAPLPRYTHWVTDLTTRHPTGDHPHGIQNIFLRMP